MSVQYFGESNAMEWGLVTPVKILSVSKYHKEAKNALRKVKKSQLSKDKKVNKSATYFENKVKSEGGL